MASLTHWDPFRALRRREELDDFFRDFLGHSESDVIQPAADVSESNGEVTVKMAVPGVEKDKIQISVDDGLLDVHGETRKETKEEKKNYYRQEIRYGAFRRRVPLPVAVDVDKARANLTNGILTITMPKSTTPKGHQIKIAS